MKEYTNCTKTKTEAEKWGNIFFSAAQECCNAARLAKG